LFLCGSEEEVQLCEGSGETAGEEGETTDTTTGAEREESTGTGESSDPLPPYLLEYLFYFIK
jgi:hypothetical protein